jgi:putative membrane protein
LGDIHADLTKISKVQDIRSSRADRQIVQSKARGRIRTEELQVNPIWTVGWASAFLPLSAWAQAPAEVDERYLYGPHMSWWWGGGWPAMILGPLFMIIVLAVAIAVSVLLVRWLGGLGQPGAGQPTAPLDVLKDRLARGEIDKAEFEERRRTLEG